MKPSKACRGSGRYRQKVKLGMCPWPYEKTSKTFLAGAWKNLDPTELGINQRAISMQGKALPADRQPAHR